MHPRVLTGIADQQQNVQSMWSTEQNASGCPQVLRINIRMFNPREVQSRVHPGVSISISDQQQQKKQKQKQKQNNGVTSNYFSSWIIYSTCHIELLVFLNSYTGICLVHVTSNYSSSWIHFSACHLELLVFLNSFLVLVTSNYLSYPFMHKAKWVYDLYWELIAAILW